MAKQRLLKVNGGGADTLEREVRTGAERLNEALDTSEGLAHLFAGMLVEDRKTRSTSDELERALDNLLIARPHGEGAPAEGVEHGVRSPRARLTAP